MKFIKVIFSIIISSIIFFLISTWYSGIMIEEKYPEFINYQKDLFKKLNLDLNIKSLKFERHFFYSELNYQAEIKKEAETLNLVANEIIYHGPFPLNHLTQANFTPLMLSINGIYTDTHHPLITLNLDNHYLNEIDAIIHINPIHFNKKIFSFSEPIKVKLNPKIKKIHIPSFTITDNQKNLILALNEVNYKFSPTVGISAQNIKDDTTELSIDSANIKFNQNTEENISLRFNHLSLSQAQHINNDRLYSKGKLDLNISIKKDENAIVNLGKLNFEHSTIFSTEIINRFPKILNDNTITNIEKQEKLEENLKNIFLNHPIIKIDSLSFKNDKGNNEIKLNLDLKSFERKDLKNVKMLLSLFNDFYFSLEIDITSMKEIIFNILSQYNENQSSESNIHQKVDTYLNLILDKSFFIVENNHAKINLAIRNNNIYLNNNSVSEKDIEQMLIWFLLNSSK